MCDYSTKIYQAVRPCDAIYYTIQVSHVTIKETLTNKKAAHIIYGS